jgi:hypothetical protein
MADTDLSTEEDLTEESGEPEAADLEENGWDELEDDFDADAVDADADDVDEVDEVDEVDDEDDADETVVGAEDDADEEEALDELEAEELEMLTDDEASETLIVDEQQELRAIRRAEISLADDAGGERAADEFQCQSCFLVLKRTQLADKRRMYCRDCAA